jgi:hypothetical protein
VQFFKILNPGIIFASLHFFEILLQTQSRASLFSRRRSRVGNGPWPAPPASVIISLAGFAPGWPQRPGGRTSTPAFFRYRLAVSRRTPLSCSMRRSVHPSLPSASICCCFSASKTFAIRPRLPASHAVNVPDGSWPYGRFWVFTEAPGAAPRADADCWAFRDASTPRPGRRRPHRLAGADAPAGSSNPGSSQPQAASGASRSPARSRSRDPAPRSSSSLSPCPRGSRGRVEKADISTLEKSEFSILCLDSHHRVGVQCQAG